MLGIISDLLQPYKEIIGQFAGFVTILQFFSGVFICKKIRDRGNTEGESAVPFVGGICMSIAMLEYANLLNDPVMQYVNYVALVLNIIYCVFYYLYSTNKFHDLVVPALIGGTINVVLKIYAMWEDPSALEYRFGLIVTILMMALLGAPLFGVREIVEKKDASHIPFVLTLMGAIVTLSWLLYSLCLRNTFMLFQNVAGFALCGVQLYLIFKYPGKIKAKAKKED